MTDGAVLEIMMIMMIADLFRIHSVPALYKHAADVKHSAYESI